MIDQLIAPSAITVNALRVSVIHNREFVWSWMRQYHSTLEPPIGWRVSFILTDGWSIYGVSAWGRPVSRVEDARGDTLQHTRMALCPAAPRNSGSYALGRERKWIRDHLPEIRRVIAYTDSTTRKGVIYLADNWKIVKEEAARHSWLNRPGRQGNECVIIRKFERKP